MATINSFEEMDIWKKAQQLGAMIYTLCDENNKIAKDFSFKDQVKRAVLSISNNIAEGFEYNNNNDFIRFLRIAKGSCGEVINCLFFSFEVKYTASEDVNDLIQFSTVLSKQIGNLMSYLKNLKAGNSKQKTSKTR